MNSYEECLVFYKLNHTFQNELIRKYIQTRYGKYPNYSLFFLKWIINFKMILLRNYVQNLVTDINNSE